MASYRHLARIAVMQTIFAYEFRKDVNPEKALEYNIKELTGQTPDLDFAKALLAGVTKNHDFIMQIMQEEAPEWPLDRIAKVDRAILEIGIYELLFSEDVPAIVAINESVEIAKSFGDTNAAKFINGVLSTVMSKYRDKDVVLKDEIMMKAAKAKKKASSKI
jgi:N utilization substance protein B